MAFQMRYRVYGNGKQVSASSYKDAITQKQRGIVSGFVYSTHNHTDELYVHFCPEIRLFYIQCYMDYWNVVAYCRVEIDENAKTVRIVQCSCESTNFDDDIVPAPSGVGSLALFKECIDHMQPGFFTDIMANFFGDGWQVLLDDPETNTTTVDMDEVPIVQEWINKLPSEMTSPYIIGHFEHDPKYTAASKIAAAFRGWKVRMKYRFDPNTTLGKHLVMTMFNNAKDCIK